LAHKTITISEEAYRALARMRGEKESFTDVILRVAEKKEQGTLLEFIGGIEPDKEFAKTLEDIVKERRRITLAAPRF